MRLSIHLVFYFCFFLGALSDGAPLSISVVHSYDQVPFIDSTNQQGLVSYVIQFLNKKFSGKVVFIEEKLPRERLKRLYLDKPHVHPNLSSCASKKP